MGKKRLEMTGSYFESLLLRQNPTAEMLWDFSFCQRQRKPILPMEGRRDSNSHVFELISSSTGSVYERKPRIALLNRSIKNGQ